MEEQSNTDEPNLEESNTNEPNSQGSNSGGFTEIRNVAYACFFGTLKPEVNETKDFDSWKPIPFKLGIVSTSIVLLLATFVLSSDLLQDRLSSATSAMAEGNNTSTSTFCEREDFDLKLDAFKEHILTNVTNYRIGKQQHAHTLQFRDALLNDTTRFGESNFKCRGEYGSKTRYESADIDLTNGPFFPGYCAAAHELALQNAMKAKCEVKRRVCLSKYCSWIFGVCCKTITLLETCPPHTWDDEIEKLQNYRVEQRRRRDRQQEIPESDADLDNLGFLQQKSTETLNKILYQVNIAGTVYSFYRCVALFFPSPLRLFRSSLLVKAKQLVFGAEQYTFVATVVIVWWTYGYIADIISAPEFKIYIKNFVTDPCFLDGSFLKERAQYVYGICNRLIAMENEWGLSKAQIDAVRPEVDSFANDCKCYLPGVSLSESPYLSSTLNSHPNSTILSKIGFDDTWKIKIRSNAGSSQDAYAWSPNPNSTFLGDETICSSEELARDEILVANDSNLSFWQLWITSALLATLIVKVALTNFAIALLRYADPFSSCGGKYECPPSLSKQNQSEDTDTSTTSSNSDSEFVQSKVTELKAIAIRDSIIWGFIANASLVSLFLATIPKFDEFAPTDYIVFGVIVAVATILPCCCFLLIRSMGRSVAYDTIQTGDDEAAYEDDDESTKASILSGGSNPNFPINLPAHSRNDIPENA